MFPTAPDSDIGVGGPWVTRNIYRKGPLGERQPKDRVIPDKERGQKANGDYPYIIIFIATIRREPMIHSLLSVTAAAADVPLEDVWICCGDQGM